MCYIFGDVIVCRCVQGYSNTPIAVSNIFTYGNVGGSNRITSYNVCYTKLLRADDPVAGIDPAGLAPGCAHPVAAVRQAEARADAEEQQRIAEIERQKAEAEAKRAREQEAEALRQAMLARAGQLAASAIGVLERDPELALLLTLEASDQAPPGSA